MKQLTLILSLFALVLCVSSVNSQEITLQPPCNCCPLKATIVLNKAEVNDLASDVIFVLNVPAGYTVRLLNPPIMDMFDDGTPFVFASGEYVYLKNSAGVSDIVSSFGDPCVTDPGNFCSGSFFYNYQMPENNTNASLYVMSTYPISGGGANATMTLYLTYELLPY